MSARRPPTPHSGEGTGARSQTGATTSSRSKNGAPTGAGALRRPAAPRTAGSRTAEPRAAAPRSTGVSSHGHAPSRPTSRPTGSATSSGSRGVGATDRGPAEGSRLPKLFSVRALVLFVVGMLAFVLLFPTVRAYIAQRADNDRLTQHVAEAKAQNEDLTAELKRWEDDAYVAAQARERLAFVLPGDTAFRVVDPETVPDPTAATVDVTGNGPALGAEGATTPWYATIWESVRVAGEADVASASDEPVVVPTTVPTGVPTSSPTDPALDPPPDPPASSTP